jgi:hypothetical protein
VFSQFIEVKFCLTQGTKLQNKNYTKKETTNAKLQVRNRHEATLLTAHKSTKS